MFQLRLKFEFTFSLFEFYAIFDTLPCTESKSANGNQQYVFSNFYSSNSNFIVLAIYNFYLQFLFGFDICILILF